MNNLFGTKAETLARLQAKVAASFIPQLHFFSVEDWKTDFNAIIESIQTQFVAGEVAVRSSAQSEDCFNSSNAGAYTSLLHIDVSDRGALLSAINTVIDSYEQGTSADQVLIQRQVANVRLSGVLMTRDKDNLSPYYVINYDDRSGSTDTVTAGTSENLKTYFRYRNCSMPFPNDRLKAVISMAEELERLLEIDYLDIEFVVSDESLPLLLQVRPIARQQTVQRTDEGQFSENLLRIHKKIQKLNLPHPGILGKQVMYSVMTDWNPAEMIGIRPRRLALSLYKELITDDIWAYQRKNYGYRDLRSFPLLISILGYPYIDVRTSINSFVPASLNDAISTKLVDYYISKLAETPSDHDKVEFRIVFSCYYLNLPQRLKALVSHGFSELEVQRIQYSLLELTNKIIDPKESPCITDLERITILQKRYREVMSADLHAIDKIHWLIEDAKRYGTLPFAGLARAGFIAMQLLESLVDSGIFTAEDKAGFLHSLNTVSRQLSEDTSSYYSGKLDQAAMIEKYGHLRPGTYDILSPSYAEAFDTYFNATGTLAQPMEHTSFQLTASQRQAMTDLLSVHGLAVDADELLSFIKMGIESREYAKFVFTKNVAAILGLISELGGRFGFSKDDLSYTDITTYLSLYADLTPLNLDKIFEADMQRYRSEATLSENIRLPQVICHQDDVYHFHLGTVEPNFITRERITEVMVREDEFPSVNLEGKIVLIRSADPGFDWIFARRIGGLVTMYGGANSHMAIRAAELRIPAVIGCGEENYAEWSRASRLDINCSERTVRVIQKRSE